MPLKQTEVDGGEISCAHTSLRRAARRLTQFYDDALAPSGFTSGQAVLVALIDEMDGQPGGEGPTLQDLARRFGVQVSGLTHALRPLTRDKLVEVRPDKADGRVKRAVLTAQGERQTRHMHELWTKVSERTEAILGKGVTDQLRDLSDRVVAADFESALGPIDRADK